MGAVRVQLILRKRKKRRNHKRLSGTYVYFMPLLQGLTLQATFPSQVDYLYKVSLSDDIREGCQIYDISITQDKVQ